MDRPQAEKRYRAISLRRDEGHLGVVACAVLAASGLVWPGVGVGVAGAGEDSRALSANRPVQLAVERAGLGAGSGSGEAEKRMGEASAAAEVRRMRGLASRLAGDVAAPELPTTPGRPSRPTPPGVPSDRLATADGATGGSESASPAAREASGDESDRPLPAAAERGAERDRFEARRLGAAAAAGQAGESGRDGGIGWVLHTLGALGLVIGLIFVLRALATRLLGPQLGGGGRGGMARGTVELLSRTAVGPRSAVLLVRVGGRVMVLGEGPHGLSSLGEINDPEQLAEVLQSTAASGSGSATEAFRHVFSSAEREYDESAAAGSGPAGGGVEARDRLAGLLSRLRGGPGAAGGAGGHVASVSTGAAASSGSRPRTIGEAMREQSRAERSAGVSGRASRAGATSGSGESRGRSGGGGRFSRVAGLLILSATLGVLGASPGVVLAQAESIEAENAIVTPSDRVDASAESRRMSEGTTPSGRRTMGPLDPMNPISVLDHAASALPVGRAAGGAEAAGERDDVGEGDGLAAPLAIMLMLTVITLAPSVVIMCTSFTRIVIVLGLLRQALGTQSLPPSQVIIGLSMFLTLLIMAPTLERLHEEAILPMQNQEFDSYDEAWAAFRAPLRSFMFDQIEYADGWNNVYLILEYRGVDTSDPSQLTYADVDMVTLVPAFMLTELKTAFMIGFRLYLPFLVVDMVVASVLISMGMLMLPPVMISLPFKLLLFVLVDGWTLVVGNLLSGFSVPGVTS